MSFGLVLLVVGSLFAVVLWLVDIAVARFSDRGKR